MALRFMDGFDHYPVADLGLNWSAKNGDALSIGTGRNSTSGLSLRGGGSAPWVRKTLDNQATWIVGFAFQYAQAIIATANLVRFLDVTSTQNEIAMTTSGLLTWTRNGTTLATGSTVLSTGSFYYIEVQVTISSSVATSACVLSINGIPEITLAATTSTKTTANAYANVIEIGIGATSRTAVIDDVYICDGTGSANNTMLGDVRVEALYPTGAGTTTQFTPLSGSNYANVNEVTEDGDTSYVSSSGITTKDTYAMGDLSSSPSNIFGIQTAITARKDDAGNRSIAPVIRSGGTDYDGTTVAVGGDYGIATEIRELDPNGSVAWTPSAVNALEAGVKLVG